MCEHSVLNVSMYLSLSLPSSFFFFLKFGSDVVCQHPLGLSCSHLSDSLNFMFHLIWNISIFLRQGLRALEGWS